MKVVVFLCLVAVVASAPPSVIRYSDDYYNNGAFNYGYELSDGSRHDSHGELRNVGKEDEYLAITGSYSWVAPDGRTYKVTYVADDQGYQPEVEEGPGAPGPIVAALLG